MGLYHKIDLDFDDMYDTFRPKKTTGPFLKIFWCSNDFMLYNAVFNVFYLFQNLGANQAENPVEILIK